MFPCDDLAPRASYGAHHISGKQCMHALPPDDMMIIILFRKIENSFPHGRQCHVRPVAPDRWTCPKKKENVCPVTSSAALIFFFFFQDSSSHLNGLVFWYVIPTRGFGLLCLPLLCFVYLL